MEAKHLLLETSGFIGLVGVALGWQLLEERSLDVNHRHNRDLAPSVAELLRSVGWKPRDLQSVIVSRGPGSYTGLRVGVMSAKTLAYATGCALVAVDTFACLARRSPDDVLSLDVISDAQQGNVYCQSFKRESSSEVWSPTTALTIVSLHAWIARRDPLTWATGPGLAVHAKSLMGADRLLPPESRDATLEALLGAAQTGKWTPIDPMTLEPLYLRPSSAEQKWDARSPSA